MQLGSSEAGGIKTRLKWLLQRRHKIRELAAKRREELEQHRMFSIFKRDVEEVRERRRQKQTSCCDCVDWRCK